MLQLHTLQNGKTLEEEAVSNIPPINPDGDIIGEDPYKPVYYSIYQYIPVYTVPTSVPGYSTVPA